MNPKEREEVGAPHGHVVKDDADTFVRSVIETHFLFGLHTSRTMRMGRKPTSTAEN